MSAENKAIARSIIEDIFNGRAMHNLDVLVTPGIIVHDTDKELVGIEALRIGIGNLHKAFPDLHYIIADMVAEGDRVALRAIGEGTQLGAFRGIPASGNKTRCA